MIQISPLLAVLLFTGGCVRAVFPTASDTGAIDISVAADGGPDMLADTRASDSQPSDSQAVDSQADDSGADQGLCPSPSEQSALALYEFESTNPADDSSGNGFHGVAAGPGTLVTEVSQPGCGKALSVPGGTAAVALPQSLSVAPAGLAAIDMWIHPSNVSMTERRHILGADAISTPPALQAHISLWMACDKSLVLRIQDDLGEHYHCSNPIAEDVWHRVAVAFGPGGSQLVVDGVLANRSDQVMDDNFGLCEPSPGDVCGTGTAIVPAITEQFVIGAGTNMSTPGTIMPLTGGLIGLIDHVRFQTAP